MFVPETIDLSVPAVFSTAEQMESAGLDPYNTTDRQVWVDAGNPELIITEGLDGLEVNPDGTIKDLEGDA